MAQKAVELTSEERMICEAMRVAIKSAVPKTTITEVAKKIDTTFDVLSSMCNGRTKPRQEVVDKVRDVLNLPKTWPMAMPTPMGIRTSIGGIPLAKIKVLGVAAAGDGETNVDYQEEVVWVPERLAAISDIAFIVRGDSMLPALQPGDVALFKLHSREKRGYTFLIKDKDDQYRIKTIGYRSDRWVLESFNPSYGIEEMPEGVQLQGFLVGWYRSRGDRETMDSQSSGLRLDKDDFFI